MGLTVPLAGTSSPHNRNIIVYWLGRVGRPRRDPAVGWWSRRGLGVRILGLHHRLGVHGDPLYISAQDGMIV